jgi:ArsR family metal-binding transcriptional regulator
MNEDKNQGKTSLKGQEGKKKKLYSINASDGIISLYKKPKVTDFNIKNKDIDLEIKQDQHAAFARYRELVKVRKEKEKLRSREPEVYHHNIYKK